MRYSIGNPQLIRNLNEGLALDLIVQKGSISRADISRLTGLSKPTVSSAVGNLLRHDLVREMGPGENLQGRKPTLVEFNEKAFYVCAIEIGAEQVRLGIFDLGEQLMELDHFFIKDLTPEQLLEEMSERVDGMIQKHRISWERIKYLACGIPAVVIPETGEIAIIVPKLRGYEKALSYQSLSTTFPCKVVLENDVNLAALAERNHGMAQEVDSFAYLSIGAGVGAGLVIEGSLFRGLGGAAGELGEMVVNQEERLEDQLSTEGLLLLARRMAAEAGESGRKWADTLTLDGLLEAFRHSDPIAVRTVEEYCRFLAAAVHNLSAVIAPRLVVLGGEIGAYGGTLIPILNAKQKTMLPVKPSLMASHLGEKSILLGATNLAVSRTFDYIREELLLNS